MQHTPPNHSATTNQPIGILLIEDNPEDVLLIQELLGLTRRFYYKLIHATSLTESLEMLPKVKPQVILTDLNLPDSQGYETFRRISQYAPETPIILLTNLDDEDLALQAIREGAQDYLAKTEMSGLLLSRSIRYAIERKHVEEALRESRERYILAMQGANDGLWDWNLKSNFIYFSPRWKSMLGYQDQEIQNNPDEWLKLVHPKDLLKVRVALASHIYGRCSHFESEYRILHKDGAYRWALARGMAVRDASGKAYRLAGSQTDITLRKSTQEQLQFDAFHDSLTGLPNRALFQDRLNRALERIKRRKDTIFAVLFLDLDRFKVINDSLGHVVGDQLLVACSHKLERCLRSMDTVSRLGGDEFVILLEDIKQAEDATEAAVRIQNEFMSPVDIGIHKVIISVSIGIVLSTFGYDKPDDILRDADIAMYHAKMRGKACHVLFESSMRQRMISRLELENDLRRAIENQELEVHYQPIVRLDDWRITGFEALIRWRHPLRGFIPPKEFIPVAEETGMIHNLGLWVLRQSCLQLRLWQTQYPLNPPLSIHVNVSGVQFSQPDFVEKVQEILIENNVDARNLSLEITESLFVENDERFNETLSRLCALGIKLKIDDFGTGYSSFSYLQRIPVSTIKIDSIFIDNLKLGNNHAEIVRSIVALAHSLNMDTIAEGVESEEQWARLKELDCNCGQGYYISRPVTGTSGQEMLRQGQSTGRLRTLQGVIAQDG